MPVSRCAIPRKKLEKDKIKNVHMHGPQLSLLLLNKFERLLPRNHINGTGLLSEAHAVALLRDMQHLRSEGCADKLAVSGVGNGLQHLCNGCTVLSVEVGVDFVEEVERCRVAGLDCEDKRESAET